VISDIISKQSTF